MDSRTLQLAQNLIRYSTALQPGENILIEMFDDALPLAQALVVEAYRAGGVHFYHSRTTGYSENCCPALPENNYNPSPPGNPNECVLCRPTSGSAPARTSASCLTFHRKNSSYISKNGFCQFTRKSESRTPSGVFSVGPTLQWPSWPALALKPLKIFITMFAIWIMPKWIWL